MAAPYLQSAEQKFTDWRRTSVKDGRLTIIEFESVVFHQGTFKDGAGVVRPFRLTDKIAVSVKNGVVRYYADGVMLYISIFCAVEGEFDVDDEPT